jgi:hypothetical protein
VLRIYSLQPALKTHSTQALDSTNANPRIPLEIYYQVRNTKANLSNIFKNRDWQIPKSKRSKCTYVEA